MDDTNPETEDQEFVRAIEDDLRWLGFDWEDRFYCASDYFERLYDCAVRLIRSGDAYVCDLQGEEVGRYRGRWGRAGPRQPVPRPLGGGEPRPVRADARRRVRRRQPHAARQDRHGGAQHEHARPGALPHPARAALPPGRPLVHLPDVRLHAPAVGCVRGHHALALHAGVRGPPPALRLVPGAPEVRGAAAADRVRAPQRHPHGAEQAQAAGAGRGRLRGRLGRPAHADAGGHAPPRLSTGRHPRLLRPHRHRQGEQHRAGGAARGRRPPGAQPHGAPRAGRAAAAAGGDRELSRGARGRARRGQQSRGRLGRHAQGAVLARAVHRPRRLPRGSAPQVLPPGPRARGAAALRLLHQVRRRGPG